MIDVKKRGAMAEIHPSSVFVHTVVRATELAESLLRLGAWGADHGVDMPGQYRAGRDLLLRLPPRLKRGVGSALYDPNADIVAATRRLALQPGHAGLPLQGPPAAGKTFTG